jgi:predicted RNA polymerase sigma factor
MIALNRIVAVTMVHGAARGLDALDSALAAYPTLAEHHRTDAVRGHLLEMTGDTEAARLAYQRAARSTLSIPEQRYLLSRAARLPK